MQRAGVVATGGASSEGEGELWCLGLSPAASNGAGFEERGVTRRCPRRKFGGVSEVNRHPPSSSWVGDESAKLHAARAAITFFDVDGEGTLHQLGPWAPT
jgi:hypothetical protein